MTYERINDIVLGKLRWTHDDWERDTPKTISEIGQALFGLLPTPEEASAYQVSNAALAGVSETVATPRLRAPFPARALRSEPGVAPFLEFPE